MKTPTGSSRTTRRWRSPARSLVVGRHDGERERPWCAGALDEVAETSAKPSLADAGYNNGDMETRGIDGYVRREGQSVSPRDPEKYPATLAGRAHPCAYADVVAVGGSQREARADSGASAMRGLEKVCGEWEPSH